ncbi:PREDICTED: AAA-ATPase At3g28510-like [Ipomoea nil]|uniref:AAA-ATPase At3g28510-like n=1 Tax=Ipomoea nil TaxID=35883 RepID=UPI00090186A9|nr:PREDICTED: AAA-ATPase At3g28510-like [Ipomoea nil]
MIAAMAMLQSWGSAGTAIASFLFMWDMIRRHLPPELLRVLERWTRKLRVFFNPYVQISINEYMSRNLKPHDAYAAVEAYLSANSVKEAKRLKAEMITGADKLVLSMDENEKVNDEFHGAKVQWISGKIEARQREHYPEIDKRYYKLIFHKKHREMITGPYLDHVVRTGKEIQTRYKKQKLYTNSHSKTTWSHIVFDHPASFEKLAMDRERKQEIVEDLITFREGREFYERIGKAWKRGYLLYGPPGTGKSTMIASMANLLNYDIYDLELTSVRDNTDLRRLLAETTSKSIIVIEDIDCSIDLTGKRKKILEKKAEGGTEKSKKEAFSKDTEDSSSRVTLSGLLNFIDGLWSACSGERIIVFTTNYVDKLDPALTRRGRMDKHIELSYCSFEGFKVLARSYLGLESHPLFESIELLMKETRITPADVAENLMPKSRKEVAERCLQNLVQTLERAKEKQRSDKGKEELEDNEAIKEDKLEEKQETRNPDETIELNAV